MQPIKLLNRNKGTNHLIVLELLYFVVYSIRKMLSLSICVKDTGVSLREIRIHCKPKLVKLLTENDQVLFETKLNWKICTHSQIYDPGCFKLSLGSYHLSNH